MLTRIVNTIGMCLIAGKYMLACIIAVSAMMTATL